MAVPRFRRAVRLGLATGVLALFVVWVPAASAMLFVPGPGSPYSVGTKPLALAVGDFNGDGHSDLAVADYGTSSVQVLLGNGRGRLTPAPGSPFAVGTGPTSIAAGDVNGDGHLDLVTTNFGAGTVSVLLGNGSGGFTPAASSPLTVGASPRAIALGDFNGDGHLDLAVGTYSPGTVEIFLGNGSGDFTEHDDYTLASLAGVGVVVAADLNGDGHTDLVVTTSDEGNNYGYSSVFVLLGDGSGGFAPASGSPFAAPTNPTSVAVADFNRDGHPDLAIAGGEHSYFGQSVGGEVAILLGDGSGRFSSASGSPIVFGTNSSVTSGAVAAGDFNSDGRTDLAIAGTYGTKGNAAWIFAGNGNGGFTGSVTAPDLTQLPVRAAALTVADFNGDGFPDFAIAGNSPPNLDVLLNTPLELHSGATNCNGNYRGTGASVVVPSGDTCTLLRGTHVKDSVTVKPKGTLIVTGVTIHGTLSVSGSATVCSSTIGLGVKATGGSLALGGSGCAGSKITGNVVVQHDASNVTVQSNKITGSLTVKYGTGAIDSIVKNVVSGNLLVEYSGPPVEVRGNHAAKADCVSNTGQTGAGNVASGTNTCPH